MGGKRDISDTLAGFRVNDAERAAAMSQQHLLGRAVIADIVGVVAQRKAAVRA
jgi:hypothetical protein